MNTTAPKRRYWIIAPGEKARLWEEFQERGIMAIGWDYLGDLRQYATREAIEERIISEEERTNKPTNDSKACYQFANEIEIGDVIIAKQGISAYLGYGVVTGNYQYDAQREEYRHIQTVDWKKAGSWMEDNGTIAPKTLIDITTYPLYVKRLVRLIGMKAVTPQELDSLTNELETYTPLIARYKAMIEADGNVGELYKWRALQHFQQHFDLDAEDFGASLTEAISKQYNLLYQRAVMFLKWAAGQYPEELREALRILFDEDRILPDRFKVYEERCDVIVEKMKEREGRDNIGHFQDERSKAFLLAMYYPERYFIYKSDIYKYLLRLLEERSYKAGQKYFHYRSIMESLHDILCRDEELIQLHRSTLTDDVYQGDSTRLLTQDLVYRNMSADTTPDEESAQPEPDEEPNTPMKNNYPLNQILFGPPGTGKTYRTKSLAVELVDGEVSEEDREELNRRYTELCLNTRIKFVTFHQSSTYEDFVEGIKPIMEEEGENGNLLYKIEDGIFKRLCIEAAYEYVKTQRKDQAATKTLTFSQLYDELMNDYQQQLEVEKTVDIPLKSGGTISVTEISSQGNFILQHQEGQRTYTVSKSRLEKLYNEIDDFDQIPNIYSYFRSIIGGSNASAYWAILNQIKSLEGQPTGPKITAVSYEDKRNAFERLDWTTVDPSTPVPNYVLIIDEINRGNIAAILGELITLLEDDKRGGQKESLTVELPYSKSRFSVPPNLFVIGTMNTADRSVEALDTALRRRFSFIEVPPKADLLGDISLSYPDGNEIDLATLLITINNRIAHLIDHDHCIGHAYFMGVDTAADPWPALKEVFHRNLLPLLQEYFFGDHGKIGLVLGEGFVQVKAEQSGIPFADFPYEAGADFAAQTQYTLVDVSQLSILQFQEALRKVFPSSNSVQNG